MLIVLSTKEVFMNLSLLHQRSPRIILGLIMLLALMITSFEEVLSQQVRPAIPILSLTGSKTDYNTEWYPDGILRIVPSDNVGGGDVRVYGNEILVPVFIDNKWTKYPGVGESDEVEGTADGDRFVPKEVYSFEFKVHYDSTAFRCVGIQKFHPYQFTDDERFQGAFGYYEPLAKDFHVEWHDYADPSYRAYFDVSEQAQVEKEKGRTIKFVGSGAKPLPRCALDGEDFRVLFYIKFKVVNNGALGAYKTPIYLGNDTIIYNDMNVCMDRPFANLYGKPGYDITTWPSDYPDPNPTNDPAMITNTVGLGGIANYDVQDPTNTNTSSEYSRNTGIRYRPGVIWAWFATQTPTLGFDVPDALISDPITEEDPELGMPELLKLVEPMTCEWTVDGSIPARRVIQLINNLDDSRLSDLEILSDQKWLRFNTVSGNNNQDPIPNETDYGYIPWIDRGILGEFDDNDPNDRDTQDDGDVFLEIKCDPNQLTEIPNKPDQPGLYTGYLTFKSRYMKDSPIRLKITFIYYKTPDEWAAQRRKPGIEVTLVNSRGYDPSLGQGPDTTSIIFGTGDRATNTVDPIYGEDVQLSDMLDPFDARWFPPAGWEPEVDRGSAVKQNLLQYGYDDIAPTARNAHSASRDIRSNKNIDESVIYYCKFNPGHISTYPVTVIWNVFDFPEGSVLFLRDAVNGSFFNVDMRNSTPITMNPQITGDQYQSYVIKDPKFNEFIIEYTPAQIIEYVDDDGNPIIKKGWNFLSLPVKPVNNAYNVVYPHAMNKPYNFSLSQWQDNTTLTPGIGYLVKYSDEVDTKFAGSYIGEISKQTGYSVLLYPGWNTIGALTVPSSVYDIEFDAYLNYPLPDRTFTKRFGVWGYKTNRGYEEVTTLEPGLGYWLKVGVENDPLSSDMAHGYYKITAPEIPGGRIVSEADYYAEKYDVYNNSSKLVLRDNIQSEGKVYLTSNKNVDVASFEMPPTPPEGFFDIRFSNNANVSKENVSFVSVQGVAYPLSVSIENADAEYTLRDAVTNEYLGTIAKGSMNTIEISALRGNSIKVVRTETAPVAGFSMFAYPNPADVEGHVNFTLPESNNVTVKLYDVVGNEVSTIVNGVYYGAGEYTIPFNVNELSAGKYIVKVTAGSYTSASTISVVR